jgi:hypothetical protein
MGGIPVSVRASAVEIRDEKTAKKRRKTELI